MNAPASFGHVRYHADLIQGSEEWLQQRCGLLTASEMRLITTPPPKPETRVRKNGDFTGPRDRGPGGRFVKVQAHRSNGTAAAVQGVA